MFSDFDLDEYTMYVVYGCQTVIFFVESQWMRFQLLTDSEKPTYPIGFMLFKVHLRIKTILCSASMLTFSDFYLIRCTFRHPAALKVLLF